MGLGPVGPLDRPTVGLERARDLAQAARQQVRAGEDPLAQRRAARPAVLSFRVCATRYADAHRGAWSPQHQKQWHNTLEQYAFPVIGHLPVASISTAHLTEILQPRWLDRTVTLGRVRERIESVLDFAATHGWRTGDNPARWRGHLENILPSRRKVAPVEHLASLHWQQMPELMHDLEAQPGIAALMLRFTILTGCRTGEAHGARWSEIDLATGLWRVPARRTKSGRPFQVPLCEAAETVLKAVPRVHDLVFAGGGAGGGLVRTAMRKLLTRMGRDGLTVHGFRSSLRDWAGEHGFPRELAELALGHRVGDDTEGAYARSDLLERRRPMMTAWAAHCTGTAVAEVVPLRRA
jgi:integrase